MIVLKLWSRSGGRWEFVPFDGGGGTHGGEILYTSFCSSLTRCSSTRRRRERAWRLCSTWRWSTTRRTCSASGEPPWKNQIHKNWIWRFVRIVDASLAEDYSLWNLPALAFFRQNISAFGFLRWLHNTLHINFLPVMQSWWLNRPKSRL